MPLYRPNQCVTCKTEKSVITQHQNLWCAHEKKSVCIVFVSARVKNDGSNDEKLLYFRLCAALEEFDYFSVVFPQAWSDLFQHRILSPNIHKPSNSSRIHSHRPTWKIQKSFRWAACESLYARHSRATMPQSNKPGRHHSRPNGNKCAAAATSRQFMYAKRGQQIGGAIS